MVSALALRGEPRFACEARRRRCDSIVGNGMLGLLPQYVHDGLAWFKMDERPVASLRIVFVHDRMIHTGVHCAFVLLCLCTRHCPVCLSVCTLAHLNLTATRPNRRTAK